MLELRSVSKIYKPDIWALKNISLSVKPGEFVSIVGKSGTGKTTLAKLLIAQERLSQGKIHIGGWDISRIRNYEVPTLRRQVGTIFQEFHLLDQKTVYENVAFALEVLGGRRKRIRQVVPEVLDIVGLKDKIRRYPRHLSGGEKQRVVIARALVHRPKLLIADEPTGNLDTVNTREVIDLLLKINELGTTVILITHNKNIVNHLKKRVITLDSGQILSDQEKGTYQLN